MTDTELKSCIGTIEMLRRLAYNIHGVMDVIDADNCEKIIKVLSDIPKYKDAYGKGWDDGAKASYEHLKMCEEEQEPCDDAISRQAVIDAIEDDNRNGHYSCFASNNDAQCFKDVIRSLPSVNPQEKTGHWIMPVQDDGMSDPIYYQVRCSKCGFDLDPQTWHQELHQYDADKYCPKCGAKMESEG